MQTYGTRIKTGVDERGLSQWKDGTPSSLKARNLKAAAEWMASGKSNGHAFALDTPAGRRHWYSVWGGEPHHDGTTDVCTDACDICGTLGN